MKYRKLTLDELEPLKGEFISFLSANGIDASLWIKYKESANQVVEDLIFQFSELVFEKICCSVDYLYFESNNLSAAYHVKNDLTTMVVIEHKSVLANSEKISNIKKNNIDELSNMIIYKIDKHHIEGRSKEVFNLLELGCRKDDGSKYKDMILKWAETKITSN